ncbi:MAG: PriCT-2 domain-containing protein, partial [Planctomycetales bacterium]|nr:PriCT-2 domain-containing protein [Planctomycetales bacterium]
IESTKQLKKLNRLIGRLRRVICRAIDRQLTDEERNRIAAMKGQEEERNRIAASRDQAKFDIEMLVDPAYTVERFIRPVGAQRKSGNCVEFLQYNPESTITLADLEDLVGNGDELSADQDTGADAPSLMDIEKAREAFANLPPEKADDYDAWVKVMLAAKFYGLRDECENWSMLSAKYDAESFDEKWNALPDVSEIRVGSLVMWAKGTGWVPSWEQHWLANEEQHWLANEEQRTENAVATRFIDHFGDDLRYVPKWGKWLVWDGTRWANDDGDVRVRNLTRNFVHSFWSDVGDFVSEPKTEQAKATTARQFVKSVNKRHAIESIVALAKSDRRVRVEHDKLDANPMLLNLQNGTYDLESGKFRGHSRVDLITQVAGVAFDPSAECPKFMETMSLIFDSAELREFVQRIFGYSMSGDTGEHILPIAIGSGFNGKSTLWNVLVDIAGDYGTLANESLLLGDKNAHPTEKAQLYQKRIVAISEPDKGAKLREARVKELTGDSFITTRRMREDFWTFRRTHTFWLSTNHEPEITGTDDGIWRRVKLIPFDVNLKDRVKPIPDYHNWLVKNEGPGILNWLLEGFAKYQRDGLHDPPEVVKRGSTYRSDQDEIGTFVAECCDEGAELQVPANKLFQEYQWWGGKLSKTKFGREMGARYKKYRPSEGEFRNVTIYHGISIIKPKKPKKPVNPSVKSDFEHLL